MEEYLVSEFERIKGIKKNDYIQRFGKLFDTNFSNYFYDTGTGKVVQLDDEEHELLSALFEPGNDAGSFSAIFGLMEKEKQEAFLKTCLKENLLRARKVEDLKLLVGDSDLMDLINHHTEQLVLEVTEKCNFRCKYCIYNEDFTGDRDFGTGVMEMDIAQKAIDYAMEHSDDTLAVTFYGGEPLLNFKLIRQSIDYALKVGKEKKNLTFSITSNMTLLTREMAEYFSNVPGLSFMASLDGPEFVQNAARVYQGNRATFDDTMRGLRYLANAFEKTGNILMINAVLIPPYEYDKINAINDFFEGLDFLPEDTEIRITYPHMDTYHYDHWERLLKNGIYMFQNSFDPLKKWQLHQAIKKKLDKNHTRNIYEYPMFERLMLIDGRRRQDKPFEVYRQNGCCVPGARKIYVKPNGDIKVCEKIGTSPTIGNIETGVDVQKVQRIFVEEYKAASLNDCSKCWAINMCQRCFADCYTETAIDIKRKREYCDAAVDVCKENLSIYYSILEEYPEMMDILKGTSSPE